MKVGLIGYGYWGKILRKYIEGNSIFELIAIYAPSLKEDGFYTNNIETIMKNKEIEAVFIASPINTHSGYIKLALFYCKHIFCEKPLCSVQDDFTEFIQLKQENDKIVYTDYIYNVSESINQMKNELGNIGNIKYIQCDIRQFGNFYKEDDVYDVLSVHYLSLILYLLELQDVNEIKINFKDILKNKRKTTLIGDIKLIINNKVPVKITANLLSNFKERKVEIIGEKGSLVFDMLDEYTVKLYGYNEIEDVNSRKLLKKWKFDENNNIKKSLNYFYQCIQSGTDNFNLAFNVHLLLCQKREEE